MCWMMPRIRDENLRSLVIQHSRLPRLKCHPCSFLKIQIFFIALAIQKNQSVPLQRLIRSTTPQSEGFTLHQKDNFSPVIAEREKTIKRDTGSADKSFMEDKIFFPDNGETIYRTFIPEPTPECKKATYCEKTTFYPSDYLSKVLKEDDVFKLLLDGLDRSNIEDIQHRIDVNDDPSPLCTSNKQVIYPKIAQNRNLEWLFIVNQDYFKQGVRIETCQSPGRECAIIGNFAEGYKTSCGQKYVYRKLAAISINGTTINDWFRLPSGCCCDVIFNDSPFSRMGISLQRDQTEIKKNESLALRRSIRSTPTENEEIISMDATNSPTTRSKGEKTITRDTADNRYAEDKILFPDYKDPQYQSFVPEPAPECKKATFCEKTTFYPTDYIRKVLKKKNVLKLLLSGADKADIEAIEQRIDVSDEASSICVSTKQVVYPQIAQNKNSEWLFIVNQDYFKQGVRIETCQSAGRDCSIIGNFVEGYKTTCKQKYIYRKLAAISKNGTTINDWFRLPSSCCCHATKSNESPLIRMGIDLRQHDQTYASKFRPARRRRETKTRWRNLA